MRQRLQKESTFENDLLLEVQYKSIVFVLVPVLCIEVIREYAV